MLKEKVSMSNCAIASLKLSVVAFTFIILKVWPALSSWVQRTSVWWFVLALVIFAVRPLSEYSCCEKKPSAKKKVRKK